VGQGNGPVRPASPQLASGRVLARPTLATSIPESIEVGSSQAYDADKKTAAQAANHLAHDEFMRQVYRIL